MCGASDARFFTVSTPQFRVFDMAAVYSTYTMQQVCSPKCHDNMKLSYSDERWESKSRDAALTHRT